MVKLDSLHNININYKSPVTHSRKHWKALRLAHLRINKMTREDAGVRQLGSFKIKDCSSYSKPARRAPMHARFS